MALIPSYSILTDQQIDPVAAGATGDTYENNGSMMPIVFNDSDHDIVVTRPAYTQPPQPLDVDDLLSTIAAGESKILAPAWPTWFNDPNAQVHLNYPPGEYTNLRIYIMRADHTR